MRLLRSLPSAATLVAVAACTLTPSVAPDGSAGPPALVAPSAPTTEPSLGPGVSVQILGDAPVLDGSAVGQEWVMPAALTYTDEAYQLFGVTFDQENSVDPRGFYATSPDGLDWTVADGDPLAGISLNLSPPGPVPGSVLREDDGSWVMFFWGVRAPLERGADLFRATAPAPTGPWTADPEPVLEGTIGAWDGAGLDFPSVVHTPDGYLMVYAGSNLGAPNEGQFGVATSIDGAEWTKEPDPVIEPGFCGEFDSRSMAIPRLREVDDGYLLFYNGLDPDLSTAEVGVASSLDGLTWMCASSQPVITGDDIPGSQGIHVIAVAATAPGPEFLVESLGDGSSSLWLGQVAMADSQ